MQMNPIENEIARTELKILQYLQPRMTFSKEEKGKLYSLQKGFEGEHKLYSLLKEKLPSHYLILTDLLLSENHTEFQIDLLLIGADTLYLLEVKNYQGDYIVENENWYTARSEIELRNPLHQLKRCDMLFRQFLTRHQANFTVESSLIFVHPEFFLYQSEMNSPMIFPTQINRFIEKLQRNSGHPTPRQHELAALLAEHKLEISSQERLPEFSYHELRKGIVCTDCQQFLTVLNLANLVCRQCGQKESMESAVLRATIELATLFPAEKITTNRVHEWCHVIESKKTIRRFLKKHLCQIGRKRATCFVFKE